METYYTQFGPSAVEKITSDPTYNKLRAITNKLDSLLAGIEDVRDAKYGKLFLLRDVQYLDGGQVVAPSIDQGPPTQTQGTPWVEMQEHIRNWNYFQTLYKDDKNVEEAAKK